MAESKVLMAEGGGWFRCLFLRNFFENEQLVLKRTTSGTGIALG